ncbi:hypothetical protein EV383_2388 [Pseudonocardia sediminis]|uniref:Tetratricopeptide repeat protein n=1 Tax=Pseudonocardia sediminis TaxID=1397368 RepID=A0A4Q7UWX4_PSEST|nr:hypothetical protein [Pseudonocardia sediminis]RZT85518.1 hypothetical protein EV383_2388 [Pseudonocardia sediminis]
MVPEPELPDSIKPADLDPDVRADLRGLQKETAEKVARHLVAAGLLVDEEPERALLHVRYARRRASRIGVVREAAGIVAYHAGEWNEALGEFRAARRMGGGPGHVPVMADIERALGRPERALELTRGPEVRDLGEDERIELLIVAAGARRDMGELDAAVVGLQVPELDPKRRQPWSARLFYAYADNLLAVGRRAEAVQWFVHAHDADPEEQTDAAERVAELTGDELPGTGDDGLTFGVEDAPVAETVREPIEDGGTAEADSEAGSPGASDVDASVVYPMDTADGEASVVGGPDGDTSDSTPAVDVEDGVVDDTAESVADDLADTATRSGEDAGSDDGPSTTEVLGVAPVQAQPAQPEAAQPEAAQPEVGRADDGRDGTDQDLADEDDSARTDADGGGR